MRISELAEHVGVASSTVRYYERVGLLATPARTASGYRDYDETDAARLLFIARSRRMGLSCEQVIELLPIWDGTNCAGAQERVRELISEKQREIAARVAELQDFASQLEIVDAALEASPPPPTCRTDLSCCVPATNAEPVLLELGAKRPHAF